MLLPRRWFHIKCFHFQSACSIVCVAGFCTTPDALYACLPDNNRAPKIVFNCKDSKVLKTCDATDFCVIGLAKAEDACQKVDAPACTGIGMFAVASPDPCKYYTICSSPDAIPLIGFCGEKTYFNKVRCSSEPVQGCGPPIPIPECTPVNSKSAHPMSCGLYRKCAENGSWKTMSCMGYFYDSKTNKCVKDKTVCPAPPPPPPCTDNNKNDKIEDAENKCGYYRKCTGMQGGWKRLSCLGFYFDVKTSKCVKQSNVCGFRELV
ncbi:hypothetical protein B566_EDAN004623 [Ephemera danica]|nr:hypothetical protein B566_EDAN004623 [Ephemera danica]